MAGAVRFVHAADLHLDATFGSVGGGDPRVGAALTHATFSALDAVVDTCLSEGVDFLVLAGDVFDEAVPSLPASAAFRRAMVRLAEAGIEVFVTNGNHDPAVRVTADLPANVHRFPVGEVDRFEVVRDGKVLCAVYGRSFGRADESEDFAAGFSRGADDPIAVGVLHTNVGGQSDYLNYAPCSADDLLAAKMDYWALGHIHLPGGILGVPHARYSGCTQGLNPKEDGPRGCLLVAAEAGHAEAVPVETCAVRWARFAIDIGAAEDVEGVLALVRSALEGAAGECGGRPVVARIELVGRSGAHGELLRAGVLAGLLESARGDGMAGDPWVWTDRIDDRSRSVVDLAAHRAERDFIGQLAEVVDAKLADPAASRALLGSRLDGAVAKFRPAGFDPDPADVLTRALDLCVDLLEGDG